MRKRIVLMVFLSVMFFAFSALGSDSMKKSASRASVNTLIQYYSKMAQLEKNDSFTTENQESQKILQFILNHKESILAIIVDTDAYSDLVRTQDIINRLYSCQQTDQVHATLKLQATADGYFDRITKHRYLKNSDGTYAEYNRKGEFFKTVQPDQPHLAKSKYVFPITGDCYLLYSRRNYLAPKQCVAMQVDVPHPDGCYLEKLLVALE